MRIFAPFAAVAALAGCASPTPAPYAGCQTWEQQVANARPAAVSVLSPDLAKVIGVREVSTSRTATNLAAVQTTVYNCSDADVVLIMRTQFSGDRGQTEAPSAWRTVHLPPRASAVYGESAIHASTSRVMVDIHDANRGQQQFAPGQLYAPAPQPAPPQR